MGWTVRVLNPGGGEIFCTCPDRPWGPRSLLYNGYRVFPGVKSGRSVTLSPDPLLMPWSRKRRAIPLLPLWAVQPVQNLSACTRVHFTFITLPQSLNQSINQSINPLACTECGDSLPFSGASSIPPCHTLFPATPLHYFTTTNQTLFPYSIITCWCFCWRCSVPNVTKELSPYTYYLIWLNNLKGHLLTQWSRVLLVKITDRQSTNSLHFMKPKSSLPHSQQPVTVPVLSQISPVCAPPSHLMKIHFNTIPPPSMDRSSKFSLSFMSPDQNPVCTSPLPHTYYMLCPSHHSVCEHPKNIWWTVQIIEPITESLPLPCSLVPLRPRHLPQNLILEHPKPMFLPQCYRPSFTPIRTNKFCVSSALYFWAANWQKTDSAQGLCAKYVSRWRETRVEERLTHLFNKILLRLTIMLGGSNTSNISITRSLTMDKEICLWNMQCIYTTRCRCHPMKITAEFRPHESFKTYKTLSLLPLRNKWKSHALP